ncbi:MAG: hypothetical protein EOP87_23895 [Verrucomicrobiaceae bacterium]|nr:MAG: hypothetical protein EOP87_23895 [Verrucomicrobiaceae bacterium]
MKKQPEEWYSVKCLLHHPTRAKDGDMYLYEERVTVWKATSHREAEEKARVEASTYAVEADAVLVNPTDSFCLFDGELGEGTEVYSLMRGSNLTPDFYENTFCVTSRDRMMNNGLS